MTDMCVRLEETEHGRCVCVRLEDTEHGRCVC